MTTASANPQVDVRNIPINLALLRELTEIHHCNMEKLMFAKYLVKVEAIKP